MKTDEMNEEFADLSGLVDVSEEEVEDQVYEVGYHLLPTIGEGAVEKEALELTAAVKKAATEIVGERVPAFVHFAYPLTKKIDSKNQEFSNGFFGWVAFSGAPSAVESVKEIFDGNANVLRFIITKTSRDQVAAVLADPSLDVGAADPEMDVEEPSTGETEEVAPETEEEEAA